MISKLFSIFAVLLTVTLSGCLTLVDESTIGEQRADADLVKAEVYKMREQVAEMQQALAKLEDEVQSLRGARGDEAKDTKNRIDELERSLKVVDASRDQMKQEIIDSISKKVADLMRTSGHLSGGNGVPPKGPGKKPVEKGYEHIVKQGETLTEIAAAYNVTPNVIIKANSLAKPGSLRVGQKLFIPE